MTKASKMKQEIVDYLADPAAPDVGISDLGDREDEYVRRMAKPRDDLVRAANVAAAILFVGKRKLSTAILDKAKRHASAAIERADRFAGTARHPHAAYSHGVRSIAAEGVAQAVSQWEIVQARLDRRA